jgi:glutathione S-transferase
MELFSARVCPYAHRTRLVLLEKGVACDYVEVDFKNKSKRFLEVSPYGKVPALVHDGVAIYESAIINEYLDEVFPDPPLMPADPALRAKARIWIDYIDDHFLDPYYELLKNRDPARHGALLEAAANGFRFMEREGLAKLSGAGPYWFGARPGLVDVALYPFIERLPVWSHYRRLGVPADCPRLSAWIAAMAGRESVRRLANPPDYYIESYRGYAGDVLAA